MAQLVGQMCVVCRERIGSVLDSRFCPDCGCPVHAVCSTTAQRSEGSCPACGAPAAEVAARRGTAEKEVSRQPAAGLPHSDGLVLLRYVIGVLLFGGFVVFVTPTELAIAISYATPGDPGGLMGFGMTCGAVLGLPGYFVFPYRRRFQAVAWLSLACMGYSLLLFGIISLMKMNPDILSSPDGREFVRGATIHYDRLAAITAVQLVAWAALFRRKRG